MAIHRRLRNAARLCLQTLRRGREALRNVEKVEGSLEIRKASGFNVRLQPLVDYVLEGGYFDTAWDLFRYGHLKGLNGVLEYRAG
jgi:hypothetical protein